MKSPSAISFENFSYSLCSCSGPWLELHLLVLYHLPEAPKPNTRPLRLRPYDSLSNQVFSDTFSVCRYTVAFNFHRRFSSKLLTLALKEHHRQEPPPS